MRILLFDMVTCIHIMNVYFGYNIDSHLIHQLLFGQLMFSCPRVSTPLGTSWLVEGL